MKPLAQCLIPLASTLAVSFVAGDRPVLAATLTLSDATQASLSFSTATNPQFGSGSFTYSSDPVVGAFTEGTTPTGGRNIFFFTDPSQLPPGFVPTHTIPISADQNLRLVTQIGFSVDNLTFNNARGLAPGPIGGDVLFFQPPPSPVFPPGPGGPFIITAGDPRFPGLSFRDNWFFGDRGPNPRKQLLMTGGSFFGFNLNNPPNTASLSGRWSAEAVPEPFSVLGTVTALACGAYLKRKLKD